MFFRGNKHHRKLESCSLVWTGEQEPFAVVSKLLKGNGVQVSKVDKDHSRIVARMPLWKDSGSCKITLRLFPQFEVCLIVTTWEPSRNGDTDALVDCMRKLTVCLDNVRLADEDGAIDWKRRAPPAASRRGMNPGVATTALEIGRGRA